MKNSFNTKSNGHYSTHLLIFHHATNLQLLDAVTNRDQFSYAQNKSDQLRNWVEVVMYWFEMSFKLCRHFRFISVISSSAERWWVRSSLLHRIHLLPQYLHCPQTSPSIWILRTHSSSLAMSVSSSQGLTSSKSEDFAMTVGSKERDGLVTTEELGADQMAEESRLSQMRKCPSGSQPKDGENKSSSRVNPSQEGALSPWR